MQTRKLDKKSKPSVCYIQETHLMCKDTHRLKIKAWRKIYQVNGEQKKKQELQFSPLIKQTSNQQKSKDIKKAIA